MARIDPKGTRLSYRMERLMLTPLFRFSLRVVLPFALCFGLGSAWLSNEANQKLVFGTIADLRERIESRPEFQVRVIAIDGGSPELAETVRTALDVDLPSSSFDLDLDALQDKALTIDAVKKADLRIRQGGILQVDIVERMPAVLWRDAEGLRLLDSKGVLVGPAARRADHAALPVIAGEGAEDAVPEALRLFAVTGPIKSRLRGFERMGARRWDVVLDRDQRIMLPETGAVQALERVIAMDEAVDMLSRDLVTVDLRLPRRPTIRMTRNATEEMWRIKAIEAGGAVQQ